jgi:hypothetical protein
LGHDNEQTEAADEIDTNEGAVVEGEQYDLEDTCILDNLEDGEVFEEEHIGTI